MEHGWGRLCSGVLTAQNEVMGHVFTHPLGSPRILEPDLALCSLLLVDHSVPMERCTLAGISCLQTLLLGDLCPGYGE